MQDNEDGVQASNQGAEDKLEPPARSLPGRLARPRQDPCRDDLRGTDKNTTLEVESSDTIDNVKTKAQGRMRSGMQIFVKIG